MIAAQALLDELHTYPNLMLWISGHRHMNVVTAQPYNKHDVTDTPENSFWEVETASLRDFPQHFRTFDIRRNTDNTISVIITNVDPAVSPGSPAAKSRGYAIGAGRICDGNDDTTIKPPKVRTGGDISSHAYNAELILPLTTTMQGVIASLGTPL
jgi:hypothetical protein